MTLPFIASPFLCLTISLPHKMTASEFKSFPPSRSESVLLPDFSPILSLLSLLSYPAWVSLLLDICWLLIAVKLSHLYSFPPTFCPMTEPMITVWYTIGGEKNIFSVSISPQLTIYHLREKIYQKGPGNSRSFGCNPKDLALTKVRYIMATIWTLI